MPRPLRPNIQNAFYHIFNRGVEKRLIFMEDSDRQRFLLLLADSIKRGNSKLYAYCLMDNHFHLFIQTGATSLSRCMQRLLSRYAQFINLKYDRVRSEE